MYLSFCNRNHQASCREATGDPSDKSAWSDNTRTRNSVARNTIIGGSGGPGERMQGQMTVHSGFLDRFVSDSTDANRFNLAQQGKMRHARLPVHFYGIVGKRQ